MRPPRSCGSCSSSRRRAGITSAAGWPANATVARQAGYAPMKLWTSHPVAAAGRVYQSRWIVRVAR
jgi:hypothetical protein